MPDMPAMTVPVMFFCTLISLFAGAVTAAAYSFRHVSNRNFVMTLAVLPVIIQSVIMLVNGKVGTGIAVMGAFSLVRFRSVPGTSREITSIFLAMALGLATGTGYLWYALAFTVLINGMIVIYQTLAAGKGETPARNLKIVITEDKNYTLIFNDLFEEYTREARLEKVRTVNLGSLYALQYFIVLKDTHKEKEFLDKLRVRNSNLEIVCAVPVPDREEL
jgi:uncharacterized membrane protein YhiD involved in acid resistance